MNVYEADNNSNRTASNINAALTSGGFPELRLTGRFIKEGGSRRYELTNGTDAYFYPASVDNLRRWAKSPNSIRLHYPFNNGLTQANIDFANANGLSYAVCKINGTRANLYYFLGKYVTAKGKRIKVRRNEDWSIAWNNGATLAKTINTAMEVDLQRAAKSNNIELTGVVKPYITKTTGQRKGLLREVRDLLTGKTTFLYNQQIRNYSECFRVCIYVLLIADGSNTIIGYGITNKASFRPYAHLGELILGGMKRVELVARFCAATREVAKSHEDHIKATVARPTEGVVKLGSFKTESTDECNLGAVLGYLRSCKDLIELAPNTIF